MSNASLFRRYARIEAAMMKATMPKTAAAEEITVVNRLLPERRPAPLTFKLGDGKVTS